MTRRRAAALGAFLSFVLALSAVPAGQNPPPSPLRLLTPQGTRPLPTLVVKDVEMIALDDLAAVFPLKVRDDVAARAIAVTWGARTAVLTPDQSLASVSGRLISLPAAPVRINGRWFVPVEFIGRALASIADIPIELRKASRLVIAGNLRVPRIVVRHDVITPQARVTIEVSPPTPHTIVQEAARLLVRFTADTLDLTLPTFASEDLVAAIHPAESGPVLAIDLGPRFGSFRAADVPIDTNTARIVIDIFPATPAAPPGTTEQAPVPATPSVPALPGTAAPVRVIVIDPGHGGDDTGAKGAKGTLEKDVTLAVARRLKGALENRVGARVLLTRDADATVGQDQRAAAANNNKADLFVSLHASASPNAATQGAEVFYLGLDEATAAAAAPAAGEAVSMPVFGGGTREIDVIPWEMAQARHVNESAALAQIVDARLRGAVPMHPRGLQQAPLRVLVGANMPAVLVELGYLTNAAQEPLLGGGAFQARLAQTIADAIVQYLGSAATAGPAAAPAAPPPPPTNPGGRD